MSALESPQPTTSVDLGSLWNRSGVSLGAIWGRPGVNQGLVSDLQSRSGISPGSTWAELGVSSCRVSVGGLGSVHCRLWMTHTAWPLEVRRRLSLVSSAKRSRRRTWPICCFCPWMPCVCVHNAHEQCARRPRSPYRCDRWGGAAHPHAGGWGCVPPLAGAFKGWCRKRGGPRSGLGVVARHVAGISLSTLGIRHKSVQPAPSDVEKPNDAPCSTLTRTSPRLAPASRQLARVKAFDPTSVPTSGRALRPGDLCQARLRPMGDRRAQHHHRDVADAPVLRLRRAQRARQNHAGTQSRATPNSWAASMSMPLRSRRARITSCNVLCANSTFCSEAATRAWVSRRTTSCMSGGGGRSKGSCCTLRKGGLRFGLQQN